MLLVKNELLKYFVHRKNKKIILATLKWLSYEMCKIINQYI